MANSRLRHCDDDPAGYHAFIDSQRRRPRLSLAHGNVESLPTGTARDDRGAQSPEISRCRCRPSKLLLMISIHVFARDCSHLAKTALRKHGLFALMERAHQKWEALGLPRKSCLVEGKHRWLARPIVSAPKFGKAEGGRSSAARTCTPENQYLGDRPLRRSAARVPRSIHVGGSAGQRYTIVDFGSIRSVGQHRGSMDNGRAVL
jgi:hypothetical protein